jgi:hypothetical protein
MKPKRLLRVLAKDIQKTVGIAKVNLNIQGYSCKNRGSSDEAIGG